ncbi:MAG: hypothetical protein R3B13_30510 [Polyangiaceae bacterium]
MRSRALLCLALAVAAPACARACNKADGKADAATEATAASGIEMLADGKEPRVKLEVGRWAGLAYGLSLRGEVSLGVVGQPTAKSPTSVTAFEFEVLHGTADPLIKKVGGRDRRYVEERGVVSLARAESDTLPPAALQTLNGALKTLEGLSSRQLIGEDGEIAEVTAESLGGKKLPAEVKEVLDQSFDAQRRFPFRLPPRPVGVGGKWRFRESVELNGVTMWQICEMSVTAVSKDSVTISLRVRHEAPRQEVPHPLQPDRRADVQQYRGDGTGHVTVDRTTAIVLEGRLATTGSLKLAWYEGDQQKVATFVAATKTELSGRIGRPPDAGVEGGDGQAGDAALAADAP